jgi:hypothetical protein
MTKKENTIFNWNDSPKIILNNDEVYTLEKNFDNFLKCDVPELLNNQDCSTETLLKLAFMYGRKYEETLIDD